MNCLNTIPSLSYSFSYFMVNVLLTAWTIWICLLSLCSSVPAIAVIVLQVASKCFSIWLHCWMRIHRAFMVWVVPQLPLRKDDLSISLFRHRHMQKPQSLWISIYDQKLDDLGFELCWRNHLEKISQLQRSWQKQWILILMKMKYIGLTTIWERQSLNRFCHSGHAFANCFTSFISL